MPIEFVKWGRTGNQVEPPLTKRNAGAKAGRPEAAQYINWLLDRLAAGANLDRREGCLLYMPLESGLEPERGVGTVTFARASAGAYVDRYGVLQTASTDNPRFEPLGLLIEGPSTNEQAESEDFDDAAWTKTRSSVTAGATDGPDGETNSADQLVEDGTASSTHLITDNPQNGPADNEVVTVSVFAKANTRSWLRLVVTRKDGTEAGAYFDVGNGAVGATANEAATGIAALADGWYRCQLSADVLSGGTAVALDIRLADSDGGESYSGDGSSGLYLFGAQWEELPFASSYIATEASEVMRSADILYADISGNAPLQAEAYTLVADASVMHHLDAAQTLFSAGESTRAVVASADDAASNVPQFTGGDGAAVTGTALTAGTPARLALVHDGAGASAGWQDGQEQGETTGQDVSDALGAQFAIGGDDAAGTNPLWGHVTGVRVYNRALIDQEMAVA